MCAGSQKPLELGTADTVVVRISVTGDTEVPCAVQLLCQVSFLHTFFLLCRHQAVRYMHLETLQRASTWWHLAVWAMLCVVLCAQCTA